MNTNNDQKKKELLIVIPTYNERENISGLLSELMEQVPEINVLVVDDNSPDGTAQIVKEFQRKHPERIFLIEREGKLGLGTAYITGFKWALQQGYQYIGEMDADFSHRVQDLLKMIDLIRNGKADVVVGSRYVKGGKTVNWTIDRKILSRGASLYVRFWTCMPIKDPTAGFVIYKRQVLETIPLDKISFSGYAFQIEMKFAAWVQGYKIVEVPITFVDRIEGSSKMNKKIVFEAIKGVPLLVWKRLKGIYSSTNR